MSRELADGAWRLEVRAEDSFGHGPVATADFAVGGTVLDVTWLSRPQGTYDSTRYVSATFSAATADGFDCRVYQTDVRARPAS